MPGRMTPAAKANALDHAITRELVDLAGIRRIAAAYRGKGNELEARFWDGVAETGATLAELGRLYRPRLGGVIDAEGEASPSGPCRV